ncbi:MAG: alanine racemase [Gammaproteobacteria bacterium]|nr:alanine racemase [Gammaproteobacteria bacterium]
MAEVNKRTWVTIDLQALRKNLSQVSAHCPNSTIFPIIKSSGYGHGMVSAARALLESRGKIQGFGIAALEEALELNRELKPRELGLDLLLLPGFASAGELSACLDAGISSVIHSEYQVQLLRDAAEKNLDLPATKLWIKLNTGMNRLGLSSEACIEVFKEFSDSSKFSNIELILMSHLGYADDMEYGPSYDFTQNQLAEFAKIREAVQQLSNKKIESSIAASAGILTLPQSHYEIVRPGVMLYGASPLAKKTGEELGLLPVMTLHSRLIAINEVSAGSCIGYGATYICDKDTRVGVVSIGYGDGYPRSAANGTPVLIKTASGALRARLIGRVSMDMITIDLNGIADAQIGDDIVLWGEDLCADEVAHHAGTISYELFCQVTKRVIYEYI